MTMNFTESHGNILITVMAIPHDYNPSSVNKSRHSWQFSAGVLGNDPARFAAESAMAMFTLRNDTSIPTAKKKLHKTMPKAFSPYSLSCFAVKMG